MNSLGFSEEAAIAAQSKLIRSRLIRWNPSAMDPNLVVNFLFKLGFTKTDVKRVVSKCPQLLLSSIEETLQPQIVYLQSLGLSASDLTRLIVRCHRHWVRGSDYHLVPLIEYLRKLLGDDEKVVVAVKKIEIMPGKCAVERMEQNVVVLQGNGFSSDDVAKFVLKCPALFITNSEKLKGALHTLEHDWGIPRNAKMFPFGINVLCSGSMPRIDKKFEILRSYGWSDVEIIRIVRRLPQVLDKSDAKMRNVLDYLMKEVGYTPDYLASLPAVFTSSLEYRVKPRYEVLKILNEKKLRKAGLRNVVCLTELEFQNRYLLPYKDISPDMFQSYLKKVGGQRIKQL